MGLVTPDWGSMVERRTGANPPALLLLLGPAAAPQVSGVQVGPAKRRVDQASQLLPLAAGYDEQAAAKPVTRSMMQMQAAAAGPSSDSLPAFGGAAGLDPKGSFKRKRQEQGQELSRDASKKPRQKGRGWH